MKIGTGQQYKLVQHSWTYVDEMKMGYQIKNGKIEPCNKPEKFELELKEDSLELKIKSIEENEHKIYQQIIQNKYQPKSLAWHQQRQMLQKHTPKIQQRPRPQIQQRPRPQRYGPRYPVNYYTKNYRGNYNNYRGGY